MLLIFAVTLAIGTTIVYVVSREMVLASFRQLEDEQMKRDVELATAVLDLDFSEPGGQHRRLRLLGPHVRIHGDALGRRISERNLKITRWSNWDSTWW